jgi:hypothetical protein
VLQDSIFDGKEENIIVIERNMSYEAVILDNYLEAIESEKKGDLYNAAKYYKWARKAFDYADVPDWSIEIGEMGIEAGYRYEEILRKIARKKQKDMEKQIRQQNKIFKKIGKDKLEMPSISYFIKEVEKLLESTGYNLIE